MTGLGGGQEMRLQLILPRVEPSAMKLPSVCPYERCQGKHFRHHQEVKKWLKDTEHDAVFAQRYECLRCKRTFRLYPQGVTRAQALQRVKGLGVMLYLLGLSYGATSLALEALVAFFAPTRRVRARITMMHPFSLSVLRNGAINISRRAGFGFIPGARRFLPARPDLGLYYLFQPPVLAN
jgi:transposase-like protein